LSRNSTRLLATACTALVLALGLGTSPAREKTSQKSAGSQIADLSAQKSLGSPSAPIKMEVFDDYECPSCGMFYEQTLKPMIDSYVAEGKVYLIHRDFPLPMHQFSRQAARWVNAAARIGKFETVERALFDNQMAWSEYGNENPKGNIKPIVKGALTPTEFERVDRLMEGCESDSHDELKGCAVDAAIQHDIAIGQLVPVNETPTFIVTCRVQQYPPGVGAISWPLMKQFFDQLLSQK